MLTTRGTGKYLTKRWNEMRCRALVDRFQFTDAELEWLEIGPEEGIVSPYDPNTWLIETQPIDGPDLVSTSPRLVDARKLYGRE